MRIQSKKFCESFVRVRKNDFVTEQPSTNFFVVLINVARDLATE